MPVPGTIPIGGLKEDAAFFTGKGADGQFVPTIPVPVDEALVERGHQRYSIYCQPCHDARGDGKSASRHGGVLLDVGGRRSRALGTGSGRRSRLIQ
jgi:mono/diheme cytochrome c family protein